jgi:hypothetical protein
VNDSQCKKIAKIFIGRVLPLLGTSGIEPEVGLEPTTLRLSLRVKSHTLYRLSSEKKLEQDE